VRDSRQVQFWVAPIAAAIGEPRLRRLQVAYAGSLVGQWVYAVALAIYAYNAGGAVAVSIAYFARLVPAALASPFLALLADRYPRHRVMVGCDLIRLALMVAAATAVSVSTPVGVAITLTALVTTVSGAFRPAQAALIADLAATPDALVGANGVESVIDGVSMFAGPAIGGLLAERYGVGLVFLVSAVLLVFRRESSQGSAQPCP